MTSKIVSRILNGDRRAVAKLMTKVENFDPEARKALAELHPHTGNAHIIGITGPPGSGKSTVVDKLAMNFRDKGLSVGIIAVDPTSPFTGGALLGDRIRMSEVASDEDVFIRSMGTRGHLGGLATTTNEMIKILDAFGKDIILVETVGAGQSEVEVVKTGHTTIIVEVPGLGDDIQAIKAGILEIGDIFIVNKSDREGATNTAQELETMLEMGRSDEGWKPKIVKTVATENKNIDELAELIEAHMDHLKESGELAEVEKEKTREEFLELLREKINSYIREYAGEEEIDETVEKITNGEIDPYRAAEKLCRPLDESLDK
ncbi:MAG: methylmalonyl Co-A mutase-associated GTPase MeaB [Candidatus Thermoplasmatota archaeon]